jgi:hypothetical protein
MSLKGIDISQHQSTTPSLEGLAFIVLRASIATTLDTKYAQHYAAARKAGLVTMAYHFGYSEDQSPIAAQAETFLAAAADADFLWLDQEEQGFTDPQAQQFVDLIRAAGRPCGLYHSSSGFGGVNVDARWVADWRAESVTAGYPRTADGSKEFPGWDLWQWQGSPLDKNYQNPDRPLAALLRKGYVSQLAYDVQVEAKDNALAEVERLTAEAAALQAKVNRLLEVNAELGAALDAAPGIERDRIALAEAERIKAI